MLLTTALVPPFIVQLVALVVASAGIAYACYRLGLVPIVGFLVAGVFIGPHALGLVSDLDLVNAAAEAGVILLLFTIGIEFSLEKLARIKRLIFVGGSLQVVLASLATMALLMFLGVDWRAGLFTGLLVSLSSTAIVLKLLGDRGEADHSYGQVAFGLLIFQDLAIIVMVLLVPMLGGSGGSANGIGIALAKAAGIILLVLLVARRLMPPLLERVARPSCSS
jgi:monovalent cation:H+ antiporter-2, CPA2 family